MSQPVIDPRDDPGDRAVGSAGTRRLKPLLPEGPRAHSTITRVGLFVASAVFFLLGVILWLTPVLTGVPFYILSIITLSMASRRAARFMNRLERRLPDKTRRWMRLLLARRERRRRAKPS